LGGRGENGRGKRGKVIGQIQSINGRKRYIEGAREREREKAGRGRT
jgi:hypothetical protein